MIGKMLSSDWVNFAERQCDIFRKKQSHANDVNSMTRINAFAYLKLNFNLDIEVAV